MTIQAAFNAITEDLGGTPSTDGTIAGAIDALNDTLAGSNQERATTIEGAIYLLGEHIIEAASGGSGIEGIKEFNIRFVNTSVDKDYRVESFSGFFVLHEFEGEFTLMYHNSLEIEKDSDSTIKLLAVANGFDVSVVDIQNASTPTCSGNIMDLGDVVGHFNIFGDGSITAIGAITPK